MYIFFLTGFIAAKQQQDDDAIADGVIQAIAGSEKKPHFVDPISKGFYITEIPERGPVETLGYRKYGLAVFQAF